VAADETHKARDAIVSPAGNKQFDEICCPRHISKHRKWQRSYKKIHIVKEERGMLWACYELTGSNGKDEKDTMSMQAGIIRDDSTSDRSRSRATSACARSRLRFPVPARACNSQNISEQARGMGKGAGERAGTGRVVSMQPADYCRRRVCGEDKARALFLLRRNVAFDCSPHSSLGSTLTLVEAELSPVSVAGTGETFTIRGTIDDIFISCLMLGRPGLSSCLIFFPKFTASLLGVLLEGPRFFLASLWHEAMVMVGRNRHHVSRALSLSRVYRSGSHASKRISRREYFFSETSSKRTFKQKGLPQERIGP